MGGFATYAQNIHLQQHEDGYWLYAKLATGGGTGKDGDGWSTTAVYLDQKIGNDHGQFRFPSGGFSTYARDVKLLDNGVTLYAELAAGGNGGWLTSTINLNSILTNDHGEFKWND